MRVFCREAEITGPSTGPGKSKDQRMPSRDAIALHAFPPNDNPSHNTGRVTGKTEAWEMDEPASWVKRFIAP